MDSEEFQKISAHLPHLPGVYKYYDSREQIIYVGKAKDLKKRIASYFRTHNVGAKTRLLVRRIARIEFVIVNSEHDAFLLENNLIKTYRPKYNINLKDDKSFPYLVIKKEPFPRILFTRKMLRDGSEYIGPFTSVGTAHALHDYLSTAFQLRTCSLSLTDKNIRAKKFKPCLEYHLGRCLAPCVGLQSSADYLTRIDAIRAILKGGVAGLVRQLKEEMQAAAARWDFETAQEKKNHITLLSRHTPKNTVESLSPIHADVFALELDEHKGFISYLCVRDGKIKHTHIAVFPIYVDAAPEDILSTVVAQLREQNSLHENTAPEIIVPFAPSHTQENLIVTIPIRGDKKSFLELAIKNIAYHKEEAQKKRTDQPDLLAREALLEQLQKELHLPETPYHIECFDNSNFQGSFPVSAMVCFKDALPSPRDYRTFNIKTVVGIDDFASMHEVVSRRYARLLAEKKSLPQLIIIDGGKGQLSSAVRALDELNLTGKISMIGLAKREEEIFFPHDSEPKLLEYGSPTLRLLQQIRDETHRFVINFHRKQRAKGSTATQLARVPGIGKKLSEKLLLTFHSVKKIKQTPMEEIAKITGAEKAKRIKDFFAKVE